MWSTFVQNTIQEFKTSSRSTSHRPIDKPPWNWVSRHALSLLCRYPTGITDMILFSELSIAWDRDQETLKSSQSADVSSILSSRSVDPDAVLHLQVLSTKKLGTLSALALQSSPDSKTIDFCLPSKLLPLLQDPPTNPILSPGCRLTLAGCRLHPTAKPPYLLPTTCFTITTDRDLEKTLGEERGVKFMKWKDMQDHVWKVLTERKKDTGGTVTCDRMALKLKLQEITPKRTEEDGKEYQSAVFTQQQEDPSDRAVTVDAMSVEHGGDQEEQVWMTLCGEHLPLFECWEKGDALWIESPDVFAVKGRDGAKACEIAVGLHTLFFSSDNRKSEGSSSSADLMLSDRPTFPEDVLTPQTGVCLFGRVEHISPNKPILAESSTPDIPHEPIPCITLTLNCSGGGSKTSRKGASKTDIQLRGQIAFRFMQECREGHSVFFHSLCAVPQTEILTATPPGGGGGKRSPVQKVRERSLWSGDESEEEPMGAKRQKLSSSGESSRGPAPVAPQRRKSGDCPKIGFEGYDSAKSGFYNLSTARCTLFSNKLFSVTPLAQILNPPKVTSDAQQMISCVFVVKCKIVREIGDTRTCMSFIHHACGHQLPQPLATYCQFCKEHVTEALHCVGLSFEIRDDSAAANATVSPRAMESILSVSARAFSQLSVRKRDAQVGELYGQEFKFLVSKLADGSLQIEDAEKDL